MAHPLPTALIGGVALASLALTLLGALAYRRRRDRRLLFVTGAFGLFFAKSLFTAVELFTGTVGHEALEMVNAGFDLLILGLLIAPFLLRT